LRGASGLAQEGGRRGVVLLPSPLAGEESTDI
jgi:hypothetical protein